MKCSKCGKEMQNGFLQTTNIIAFNQTRHKISLNPKNEAYVMIARKAFTGTDFQGYICKECGLVVFDYKNGISRF